MKIFTRFFAVCIVLIFTTSVLSQPQYYNYNNPVGNNVFPFGTLPATGKTTQTLYLPGAFNQPGPAPMGTVTKVYFQAVNTTSATFTQLTIKMKLTTDTDLPTGMWDTAGYTTVFNQSGVTVNTTADQFFSFNLSAPFVYDPSKSLIIEITQCGYSGGNIAVRNTTLSGTKRHAGPLSAAPCPHPWGNSSAITTHTGLDITPMPTICTRYSSLWCAPLPPLPTATFYQAAAWLGDTLYVQAPTTTGTGDVTIYRYTVGGSWSTGVPLPVQKTGGSLTAAAGKLYYIGGSASVTTGSTDIYEYNPATGTWTLKAPMPASLSGHGAVNWGDSVIFVVGGPWTGSGTNLDVHYYRIPSNTWGTITASLPSGQGRRSHATGIVGNKIFIAAGFNTAFLKNLYIGTIGSNASVLTWTAGPDIPTPWTGISRTGGIGYGDYFYVVAGERGGVGGYSDSTFVFNVNTNVWQHVIDNKPTAVSNMWNAVAVRCVNDTVRLYVPGGYNGVGVPNFDYLGCGPSLVGITPKINTELPNVFELKQNYPNPFNPLTQITFSLPKASYVDLRVYDMLGREVALLINQPFEAGSYTTEFDGTKFASGVYFYTLRAGDFTDTKKMVLVK
jgi:N-acetylneuraminic acid mutarotase